MKLNLIAELIPNETIIKESHVLRTVRAKYESRAYSPSPTGVLIDRPTREISLKIYVYIYVYPLQNVQPGPGPTHRSLFFLVFFFFSPRRKTLIIRKHTFRWKTSKVLPRDIVPRAAYSRSGPSSRCFRNAHGRSAHGTAAELGHDGLARPSRGRQAGFRGSVDESARSRSLRRPSARSVSSPRRESRSRRRFPAKRLTDWDLSGGLGRSESTARAPVNSRRDDETPRLTRPTRLDVVLSSDRARLAPDTGSADGRSHSGVSARTRHTRTTRRSRRFTHAYRRRVPSFPPPPERITV